MEQTPQNNFSEDNSSEPPQNSGLTVKQANQLVSWAKNQFLMLKQARSNVERQWYINMCFFYGKQNVAFRQNLQTITGTAGLLYVPPAPYWRARPVINRIRPIIRGELAKLTSQKPTAFILPATSDDSDMFAAKAGEQIWESLYQNKKIPSKFRQALWWNQVCGNSFVKAYWDPSQVDTISNLKGDLCYDAVTPFHIFVPDLREPTIEAQPFIIHAQLKSPDWVRLNYPQVNINVTGDARNEILDDQWLNILGGQNLKTSPTVLALECWIKPGQVNMFPNGGVFTVIGDSLVQYYPSNPYNHGEYPFAKLDHIPTGKFYSESSIVDLIPLQREYNRTRGQIIESKNKMSKPQLVAEKGSIEAGKITSEPGQVIEYQPGFNPPQPLPLQPLPNYVLQELDRILLDINDISGQHEVSKGQTPPGVTAATAINYLQEQDDSILSFTFSSLEEAYEKVAGLTLKYIQQYWDVPRLVKVAGDDEYFDVLRFKGSDLRDNTDIRIEAGSALPISKAAKQAFIMDLMKMGFIDPATGLEVMEMGGVAKIYEAVQVDVRQAQRENLRIAQIDDQSYQMMEMMTGGQSVVPVNSFDNHQLHIETHNKYRKSQQYEALSDSAKIEFEKHVQMHALAMTSGNMGINLVESIKNGQMLDQMQQPGQAGSGGANQGANQFQPPVMPDQALNQEMQSQKTQADIQAQQSNSNGSSQ